MQAQRIKPNRLNPGDTIGIIAPASPTTNIKAYRRGIKKLEALGYKIVVGEHVWKRYGYLAGTDSQRANDLNRMFADKRINAIFCLRGGYGCARILPYLDYLMIKNNPKIFVGFSDTTVLSLAIYRKTGLVTFYGPMVASNFGDFIPEYTEKSLFDILTNLESRIEITNPKNLLPVETVYKGIARGKLVGGCLSLITSTLGSEYEIDTRNKILFFEDVGEEPYRVDRMITQLCLASKLQSAAGIIVGKFKDCDPKKGKSVFVRSFRLEHLIDQLIKPLKIPTVYGLYFGHHQYKSTIPIGVQAVLDATKGKLILTEPAVT